MEVTEEGEGAEEDDEDVKRLLLDLCNISVIQRRLQINTRRKTRTYHKWLDSEYLNLSELWILN